MNRQQMLDLYFMDARSKLIDLAAFFDRIQRSPGEADFRLETLQSAIKELNSEQSDRAARVLMALSDPSTEPILAATTKAAAGAFKKY